MRDGRSFLTRKTNRKRHHKDGQKNQGICSRGNFAPSYKASDAEATEQCYESLAYGDGT